MPKHRKLAFEQLEPRLALAGDVTVYLNFTGLEGQVDKLSRVNLTEAQTFSVRGDIQAKLETIYAGFPIEFTQDQPDVAHETILYGASTTDKDKATLLGEEPAEDWLNRLTTVSVVYAAHFDRILVVNPEGPEENYEYLVNALASTGAHELGHALGLGHYFAYGDFSFDVRDTDGDQNAHLMSTGETGKAPQDRRTLVQLSDLEFRVLDYTLNGGVEVTEMAETGASNNNSIATAQSLTVDTMLVGEVDDRAGIPAEKKPSDEPRILDVVATLSGATDKDYFSFAARAGDFLTAAVRSWAVSATLDQVQSQLSLLNAAGNVVQIPGSAAGGPVDNSKWGPDSFGEDGTEPQGYTFWDPTILHFKIPEDGQYFLLVEPEDGGESEGDYHIFVTLDGLRYVEHDKATGKLYIWGDDAGDAGVEGPVDDEIFVRTEGDLLRIDVNGVRHFIELATVNHITIRGGGGNDTIEVLENVTIETTIKGEDGDDEIAGGGGRDAIAGGKGKDTIYGRGGNDDIRGEGDGITEAFDDNLYGGDGEDDIRGGYGDDTIEGGEGNDTIFGGDGADTLKGDAGNDEIKGEEKDDTIEGGAGEDRLIGDQGNDTLRGGDDKDTMFGGDGSDILYGGGGDDELYGDHGGPGAPPPSAQVPGSDQLFGEEGNDTLDGGIGNKNDTLDGGPGQNAMLDAGGFNNVVYSPDDADDTFTENLGQGTLSVVTAGSNIGTIAGRWHTEIGGVALFDALHIAGGFDVDGATLEVDLVNFAPSVGLEFTIITSDSALTGEFAAVDLSSAALVSGRMWEIVYQSHAVVLRVISAGANLIPNGSFENPVVTANGGQWELFSSIPDWTLVSGQFELQRGILGGAAEGAQHAELDTTGSSAISRVVSTAPGETYTLTFAFAGRPGTAEWDNALDVRVVDVVSGAELVRDLISDAPSGWRYYSYTFTANGMSTEVVFRDVGVSNSLGTFLDDVYVTETSDSLPTPENPVPNNLVVNGGFEQLTVTDHGGTWHSFTSIPGWTLDSGAYFELQRGILGGPTEGSQHAELDSTGNTSISQTLRTTANDEYEFSFAFAGRPGTTAADNVLAFSVIDVATSATLFSDTLTTAPAGWAYFTYQFSATGAQTKLVFADTGTSNSLGTFIDDVSVKRLAAELFATFASESNLDPNEYAVIPAFDDPLPIASVCSEQSAIEPPAVRDAAILIAQEVWRRRVEDLPTLRRASRTSAVDAAFAETEMECLKPLELSFA